MVLAVSKKFDYESCKQEIPMFWKEHYAKGNGKYVCGMLESTSMKKWGMTALSI